MPYADLPLLTLLSPQFLPASEIDDASRAALHSPTPSASPSPVHINHLNYVESTFFVNTTIITPILPRKPDTCVTWPSAALFWAFGEGGFGADEARDSYGCRWLTPTSRGSLTF